LEAKSPKLPDLDEYSTKFNSFLTLMTATPPNEKSIS